MRLPNAIPGRIARAWIVALLGVLVAVAASPRPAAAHARFVQSSPASGAALAVMPSELTVELSETIDPAFCSASLFDAAGAQVAIGALTVRDDATMVIPITAQSAAPGVYTLVWRVLSEVDGHVNSGSVVFSVGTGVAPSVTSGSETGPAGWRVAVRWLQLSALTFLTGLAVFALVIARVRLADLPEPLRSAGRVTLWAGAGAHLIAGYDLGLAAAGRGALDPPSLAVYREILTNTTNGASWLGIAIALAGIALAIRNPRLGRAGGPLALIAGLGALYATSAAGHAAGVPPAWRSIAIDWVHFASVAAWLGALAALWLMLLDRSRGPVAGVWVLRFSTLGVALIGVIVVTGILRAAGEVTGPRTLTSSSYGRVLIAKHALFIAVLIAAGVNQLLLAPMIRNATKRGNRIGGAVASVRRFITIELAASILMLLAAAALTKLPPADAPLAIDVASRPVAIDQRAPAGELFVELLAQLDGSPTDRYTVTVQDASGGPPSDVQRVIVQSSIEIDGAPVGDRFDAVATPGQPGNFEFPSIRLGLAGQWTLSIIVRRAGLEDVTATVPVDTSNAFARAPRITVDEWRWPRITIPAWILGVLAFTVLVGGVALVKVLRGIEPFAAGIILTMTALIVSGFAVQSYRQTVPVTAGVNLTNPIPKDDASIQRGAGNYMALCLECHAVNGRGVNAANSEHAHPGTSLVDGRTQNQRDGDLFWNISTGMGGTEMPAFDEALTEQERWDLVNYIRYLPSLPETQTSEPDS